MSILKDKDKIMRTADNSPTDNRNYRNTQILMNKKVPRDVLDSMIAKMKVKDLELTLGRDMAFGDKT